MEGEDGGGGLGMSSSLGEPLANPETPFLSIILAFSPKPFSNFPPSNHRQKFTLHGGLINFFIFEAT